MKNLNWNDEQALGERVQRAQTANDAFKNDPLISEMEHFNLYARDAYLRGEITRDEYLSIERAYENVCKELKYLSVKAKNYLKEILSDL